MFCSLVAALDLGAIYILTQTCVFVFFLFFFSLNSSSVNQMSLRQ